MQSHSYPHHPSHPRRTRRAATMLLAAVAGVGTFLGGSALVKDVQFARAQETVEQARQSLATVQDMASAFKTVGRAVEPSVVSIQIARRVAATDTRGLRPFFPDTDGDGQPDVPEQVERGSGSGVIMEADGAYGYVMTNNHVAGGASELVVTLADGRTVTDCKVLGTDPKSDLALVRIKAPRLIAAKWGDSEQLEKGDIVLAFGAPFGFVGSMTQGIVSAKNRSARIINSQYADENFLQVDAAINPGNSGGPLVNLRGEVVGINTAIASRSGGFQGIGFSIPSNQVKHTFEQLKSEGRIVRGYLGVEIRELASVSDAQREAMKLTEVQGAFIQNVQRNAPASGRLQPGDLVTQINDKAVTDGRSLRANVSVLKPGSVVKMTVLRAGKPEAVEVTLGEQPDDLSQMAQTPEKQSQGGIASLGLQLDSPNQRQLEVLGISGGAVVRNLASDSPAAQAGLDVGDVITAVGGKPVADAQEAIAALQAADLSKGVQLNVTNRTGEGIVFLKLPSR